jgi:hypothetical protein
MRALSGMKDQNKANDAIVHHPSVRKLLLFQKAVAEGGRSMIYECAFLADAMKNAVLKGDTVRAAELDGRLGFLTPILKGFLTEKGSEAANCGLQVWGGHGFIKENFQEQIVRDIRIACLWEGTTQIQGLDLLGRKILPQKLKPFLDHYADVIPVLEKINAKSQHDSTSKRAGQLITVVNSWKSLTLKVVQELQKRIKSGDPRANDVIGVASVDYLMYSGYIHLAYHWLLLEDAANNALADSSLMTEERAFYEAKSHMAEYVFQELLPRTRTFESTMFSDVGSIMDIPVESLSFDYAR